MPQIDPQALVQVRAAAAVAARRAAANSDGLLRVGGAAGEVLAEQARNLGLAEVRGRLTAMHHGTAPVTSFLKDTGSTDAAALASNIDNRFNLLDRALGTGSFGSVDRPGPSRVLVFDTAARLQGDLERAHEGIEGLAAVGGIDAARGAGLLGSDPAAWETAAAVTSLRTHASGQARQAAAMLESAAKAGDSGSAAAASIDGGIARLQQAVTGLARNGDGSLAPHAETARAIVRGATRGNVRASDIDAIRDLAKGVADEMEAAASSGNGAVLATADTPLARFVRATAQPRVDALAGVGDTAEAKQVTAANRTFVTLSGLFDGASRLIPGERRTDVALVRAAASPGIGLYAKGAVPEATAAAKRVLESLGDSQPAHSVADQMTNTEQVAALGQSVTDLDSALKTWDAALQLATADAKGTGSSQQEFQQALTHFSMVVNRLHRAEPNVKATVPVEMLSGFDESLATLDKAVFHMQMIADGTRNLGTSVWPKFGELGKVKGSLASVKAVAEMSLDEARNAAAIDPGGAATSVVAAADGSAGVLDSGAGAATATAESVLDSKLPFHQIREDQVGSYLKNSALKQVVIHRTKSEADVADIARNGPDALRNHTSAFGKGFYTSFIAQTTYGSSEVRLAVDTPRVAEFNSKRAFDDYVRGAGVNGAAPDSVRELFLSRGYGAAVVNQSNYNDAYVIVYDLSGARVVVDEAGKP